MLGDVKRRCGATLHVCNPFLGDASMAPSITVTLRVIENSTHIKLMCYALVSAVLLRAIAKLIAVLRKRHDVD